MRLTFSEEEWNTCLKVLNALKDNSDNITFKGLITSDKNRKFILKKEGVSDLLDTEIGKK